MEISHFREPETAFIVSEVPIQGLFGLALVIVLSCGVMPIQDLFDLALVIVLSFKCVACLQMGMCIGEISSLF